MSFRIFIITARFGDLITSGKAKREKITPQAAYLLPLNPLQVQVLH